MFLGEKTMQKNAKTVDFNKAKAKRRRKKKPFKWGCFTFFLLFVLCGIAVALSLTVLFPVQTVTVSGKTRYSSEEVLAVANIKTGENLFLSGHRAEENIVQQLPWVSTVEVGRKLPGSVILKVTEATAVRAYTVGSDYYLTDKNGKILAVQQEAAEKVITVVGSTAKAGKPGTALQFEKNGKLELANELLTLLANNKISCTAVDLTDDLDLSFTVENRLTVQLGSIANAEKKCLHLKTMLSEMEAGATGKINLKFWTEENPQGIYTRS